MGNSWSKSCGYKLKHKTAQDAKKHKESIYNSGKSSYRLHVYKCDYCGRWHVGSAEPKTPWEFKAELGMIDNKIVAAAKARNYSEAARHSVYKSGLEHGLKLYQRLSGTRWQQMMEAREWAAYYKVRYERLLAKVAELSLEENST